MSFAAEKLRLEVQVSVLQRRDASMYQTHTSPCVFVTRAALHARSDTNSDCLPLPYRTHASAPGERAEVQDSVPGRHFYETGQSGIHPQHAKLFVPFHSPKLSDRTPPCTSRVVKQIDRSADANVWGASGLADTDFQTPRNLGIHTDRVHDRKMLLLGAPLGAVYNTVSNRSQLGQ